jgi:hypothetical protein
MEQKKKPNFTLILIALGGVLLATTLFTTMPHSCTARATIPELAEKDKAAYRDYIVSQYRSPAAALVDAFKNHDIVYLGDSFSHNNFEVVRKIIPDLYRQGVGAIGIEFALAEDQTAIDALLTADEYDELKARDLLTNQLVFIAYQECLELFRAVWNLNHGLARSARPLRIIGLGVKINTEYFTKEEYRNNKEIKKKALNNMTLDEGYFRIINAEIIQKKARALLYMSTYNCFENVKMKNLAEYYAGIDLDFKGTVAMMTRPVLQDRQFCMIFNNVWPLNESQALLFPVGGVFEAVIRDLPSDKRATVFGIKGSPFADLALADNFIGTDDQPVRFKDLGDAYILNGELASYRFSFVAEGSISAPQMEKIYRSMGGNPADAKAKTPEAYIAWINEQITLGNKQFADLPR